MKLSYIIAGLVSTLLFKIIFNISIYESISAGLFIYYFIKIIDEFGNSIWIILDLIIIQAILMWLVIPIFFYHYFNESHHLAVIWVKTMPIKSNDYYGYVLPALLSMSIGLQFTKSNIASSIETIKARILNNQLIIQSNTGLYLILISFVANLLDPFLPSNFDFILFLFKKLVIIGLLYLFFSNNILNYTYILIGFASLILGSIRSAMFGELIFLSVLSSIIIFLKYQNNFTKKIIIIISGVFLLILFQNIKLEYRKIAWKSGGDPTLFFNIIVKYASDPSLLFDPEKQFFNAVRLNQGWLIATTMNRVPRLVPFANGETIIQSILSIIVPRFFWPDKAKSGGQYNLTRFLGFGKINYSMNISPVGEAYANFGIIGGIIFMLFYGLFFCTSLELIIKICETKAPTIILWLPLLFQNSISVETDVLTTVNSLLKSSIFVYLIYKIWPIIFNENL